MSALLLVALAATPGVDYTPGAVDYAPVSARVSYAPGSVHLDKWPATRIAPVAPGSTNAVKPVANPVLAPVRPVAPPSVAIVTGWRQPSGHTHTCPKCGEVFDHLVTRGHVCPVPGCGGYQDVQDRFPKLVPVRTLAVAAPAPVVATATYRYTIGPAAPACVGPNCPLQRR